MTTLFNRFAAENPDIRVTVSTVPWPGYNQLSAQLGAGDIPDVVTMHESAIPDYRVARPARADGGRAGGVGCGPGRLHRGECARGDASTATIWGLPFDTWAPLWHINLNYFRQAGLVRDGKPILPDSPEELLAQARQFKEATGKPYFVQALANQKPAYARNLYTFLMQQDVGLLRGPAAQVRLQTPEAQRGARAVSRQIYAGGSDHARTRTTRRRPTASSTATAVSTSSAPG